MIVLYSVASGPEGQLTLLLSSLGEGRGPPLTDCLRWWKVPMMDYSKTNPKFAKL